jgi:hypothetical protein
MVHRPLGPAQQGALMVARGLAAVRDTTDAPLVIFRNADAIHLPWISYGRAMRTPQDGMTVARSEVINGWYSKAMDVYRLEVLQTFGLTVVRGDASRDGIHYRTTRHLSSHPVPRTVLQLFLLALCTEVPSVLD